MVFKPFRGMWPKVHPAVRVAENVTVAGDVTLEGNVNLWFGVI